MFGIARPQTAEEILTRRRCRQEYQAAPLIHRHRRPDVGVAGGDAVMDERIEAPAQLAAASVEAAPRAERRIDAFAVSNRRADHDDATAYDRCRGDLEF